MGVLPLGACPRAILGPHVTWESLGSLARYQRGSKASEERESIEAMVVGPRGYTGQHLDMEFRLSH